MNTDERELALYRAERRVREIQTKLHRWATDDPGQQFHDLFNLVCDPAFLLVAWQRVRGNRGARAAGVDGDTAFTIEHRRGVDAFLAEIRDELKARQFRPLPVRERMIPKANGKHRRLGIATVRDRVVQAALKLVLEPIFEADFLPCSYGFRPNRRAHDAIAEIRTFAGPPHRYEWAVEGDIAACFDEISHPALLDRIRRRISDKRVLALIKAFLKAGIFNQETGLRDSPVGAPQGGILSPLLANIVLSVLDEHLMRPWKPGGSMSTPYLRSRRRVKGLPRWRIIRYADDFVVLVHGDQTHVEALREDVANALEPLGLRLSESKTQVVHMGDGFNFLGFLIRWKRKRGTNKWHVYTFIADRPIRSVKAKIRALTNRKSQQPPGAVLTRLNQVMRGWTNYFRHAACKRTLSSLFHFVWWRVIRWFRALHRWRWKDVRRRFTTPDGRWKPIEAEGITLFNPASVPVTRYRYRGTTIPNPWTVAATA